MDSFDRSSRGAIDVSRAARVGCLGNKSARRVFRADGRAHTWIDDCDGAELSGFRAIPGQVHMGAATALGFAAAIGRAERQDLAYCRFRLNWQGTRETRTCL